MESPLREVRRAPVGATDQGGGPIGAPEHVVPFIGAAFGAGNRPAARAVTGAARHGSDAGLDETGGLIGVGGMG